MKKNYVVGVDYGTDSCRVLVVDAADGREVASAVSGYTRWSAGRFCDPAANRYRQHPQDYIDALEESMKETLAQLPPEDIAAIRGLCFDTTGSTPVLTDAAGTPLALTEAFADDPDAMFVLWKDHTALKEADLINALAHEWKSDYTFYSGGTYSSEWVWAKVLHVLRVNPAVKAAAYSWVEHCDWMAGLLTGNTKPETILRSRCAAGHKAMWHASWGLPDREFLTRLDPALGAMHPHLFTDTCTSDTPAGRIIPQWATRIGLPVDTVVAVGALDAHMGAVGASVAPGVLVRIIGTSTCDIMVADQAAIGDRCIEGICGQVVGSVLPGLVGLEAGQSAFGDIYAWFKEVVAWPLRELLLDSPERQKVFDAILPALTAAAEKLSLSQSAPVALDWMNGRRTPYADQSVTGAIAGLTLGTSAPAIFRALVESTVFGSRSIVEHLQQNGAKIDSINAIGGICKKSPFVMQTMADVLEMPIRVIASDQACALGSAMFASVAAGIHPTMDAARRAMSSPVEAEYRPRPENAATYRAFYEKYLLTAGYAREIRNTTIKQ